MNAQKDYVCDSINCRPRYFKTFNRFNKLSSKYLTRGSTNNIHRLRSKRK